jgi:hypothetical protein
MFCPPSAEWPIQHADIAHTTPPRGGVAPLRYDLALARYLEKQAEYQSSAAHRLDLWYGTIRCTWLARNRRTVFEALGAASSEQPRRRAG